MRVRLQAWIDTDETELPTKEEARVRLIRALVRRPTSDKVHIAVSEADVGKGR